MCCWTPKPAGCQATLASEATLFCYPGAIIAVHGDMDDSAYYSATFEGRTGLVPANFVQELALADLGARQRLFDQVSGCT